MHDILTLFKPNPGVTGITISDDCVTVAHILRDQNATPKLTTCIQRRYFSPYELNNVLKLLSKELRLQRSRCTTLLPNNNYTLLLTDTPNVPNNELIAALRWQVKDLIDRPVEATTFEAFPAPKAADINAADATYVLAADNDAIQQRADLLTTASINLHSIDTHEMALRNIGMLLPELTEGVAILWLNNNDGTLIIVRDNDIYLTRTISLGLDRLSEQLERDDNGNTLILEIQRSLDYYETRFQSTPIRHLILAPGILTAAPWLPALIKQEINLDAEEFDLEKYIDSQTAIASTLPSDCFITIGAALRHEAAA